MTVAGGPGICACGSAIHRHHGTPHASTVGSSSRAERLRSCAFTSGPLRSSRVLHLPSRGRPSPRQTLRPCAARNPLEEQLKQDSINVNLRSEAEAPWRSASYHTSSQTPDASAPIWTLTTTADPDDPFACCAVPQVAAPGDVHLLLRQRDGGRRHRHHAGVRRPAGSRGRLSAK